MPTAPIASTAPVRPPVITAVVDNVGAVQGVIAQGSRSDDTTPTLQGTSEPGTRVELFDHGVKIGEAITGPDWQWSFTPATALPQGLHSFTVVASRQDGSGTSAPSGAYAVALGAVPAPLTPVITDISDAYGPTQGHVAQGGRFDDTQPTLKGTSQPGVRLEVFDNGVKIGEAVVGADWQWSFTPSTPLPAGSHAFTVVASSEGGSTASGAYRCTLSAPSNATTTLSLDPITADNTLTNAEITRPVKVTGQAHGEFSPGDIVVLSVNGEVLASKVGADGRFAFEVPAAALINDADDTLQVKLFATDASGNTGTVTLSHTYIDHVDAPPSSTGNTVSGVKDSPRVLAWEDFKVTDLDSGVNALSVHITKLPVEGRLEWFNGTGWVPVTLNQSVPAERIAGGYLRFMPGANGASDSTQTAPGVGNLKQHYAQFEYTVADQTSTSAPATLTLDIRGVADAADLHVQMGRPVAVTTGSTVTGHHHALQLSSALTDTDGSETLGATVKLVFSDPALALHDAKGVALPRNADGSYSVAQSALAGLQLYIPLGHSLGTVTAYQTTTERGEDTRTTSVSLSNTDAPQITVLEDSNHDGVVTRAELSGKVDVRLSLPSTASVGDTLTLTTVLDNSLTPTTTRFVLTSAQLNAGYLDTSLTAPADGRILSLSADITDHSGNLSQRAEAQTRFDLGQTPATTGGNVSGTEDTAKVLAWADFHVTDGDSSTAQLQVQITQLPQDGRLEYFDGKQWLAVKAQQLLSASSIAAGQLRFVPDPQEAGADAYQRAGVGNGFNDYARFSYVAVDAQGHRSSTGTLNIDIQPIADGTAKVALSVAANNSNDKPAGHAAHEVLKLDGKSVDGYWHAVTFNVTNTSPDTDGSERVMVKFHINNVDQPSPTFKPYVAMLADGTRLVPDANGDYWIDPHTTTKVYEFRELGYHQSVTATAYTQEVNAQGQVLNQLTGNTVTSASYTPLVLDLDGNGVQTVSAEHGVAFDLLANGQAQHTGWTDGHDGLLVLDRNHNGRIDNGTELFGDATLTANTTADNPQGKAADGFAALRSLDNNGDGQIDRQDSAFQDLQVWVDRNLDGQSQADELLSLSSLGITTFNLSAQESSTVNNGNHIGLISDYTTADGTHHQLADIWFSSGNQDAPAVILGEQEHALDTLLAHAGLAQSSAAATVTAPPLPAAAETSHAAPTVTVPMPPHADWTP